MGGHSFLHSTFLYLLWGMRIFSSSPIFSSTLSVNTQENASYITVQEIGEGSALLPDMVS